MRILYAGILVLVPLTTVAADEFVEACRDLLQVPELRQAHEEALEAFIRPVNLKIERMQSAIGSLRGEQRIGQADIDSQKERVSAMQARLEREEDQKRKERAQKQLERQQERLKRMEIQVQLEASTTDREAKAKELEARAEKLRKDLDERYRVKTEEQKQEINALSASLQDSLQTYSKGILKFYKDPPGDFQGAKLAGSGGNAQFLMISRTFSKDDITVLVTVSLLGRRELPGNHTEYRDGIRTWTTNFGNQSKVIANVGAFETHLTVVGKQLDRDSLNQLLDGWLDLEGLGALPLPGGALQP